MVAAGGDDDCGDFERIDVVVGDFAAVLTGLYCVASDEHADILVQPDKSQLYSSCT